MAMTVGRARLRSPERGLKVPRGKVETRPRPPTFCGVNAPSARPAARLGYAVEDLEAFLDAGEQRVVELVAAIAVAEARRDHARERTGEAPALRRRIAEEWMQAWQDANPRGPRARADAP